MKRSSAPSQRAKQARGVKRKYPTSSYGGQQLSLVPKPSRFLPRFGLPNRLEVKHRYTDRNTLTSTTGALQQQLFRANGMFDPYQTGGGHQPMYFDEMAALYDHFTVLKSVATFTITGVAGNSVSSTVCVYLDDDTTPHTTIAASCEDSTAVWKHIGPGTGGANDRVVLRKWWTAKSFGPQALDNDNLQGTGSSDPTEQTLFCLMFAANVAGTTTIDYSVDITYYAVWDELKTNAGS